MAGNGTGKGKGKRPAVERVELGDRLVGPDTGKLAFVLKNVFTAEECAGYVKRTEAQGYSPALVNIGHGRQRLMPEIRNNDRCMVDSVEEADKIWQRIKAYVPVEFKSRTVVGLNERLRFLRYIPGQCFKPHYDGCFARDNGEASLVTVHLYLNNVEEGGSTRFLSDIDSAFELDVKPEIGSVLVFQHDILHQGSELTKGKKYTVRTDVMYGPVVKASTA